MTDRVEEIVVMDLNDDFRKDVLNAREMAAFIAAELGKDRGTEDGGLEDPQDSIERNIQVFESIGSTNTYLKELAPGGAAHGTVIAAESQTDGRGRLGRSFASPAGCGIYISVLLRIGSEFSAALSVTTAAAVAVCETIRDLTGREAGIKWVNDIYIGEKKICGILAEAVSDPKTGKLDSVVVGMGINFRADPDSYPDDVIDRIGWIYDKDDEAVSRNRLAAGIIAGLLKFAEDPYDRSYIDVYRKRSVIIGRNIRCFRGKEVFDAYAVDIDDKGGLIIESGGKRSVLSTGEISVRWRKD